MLKLKSKFFLTGEEVSAEELQGLLNLAIELKKNPHQSYLKNKTVALVFEKPSLRTRVSFTVAIQELGGHVIELTSGQKKHEDPEDTIRVMQGYVDAMMIRTFAHDQLEKMARFSKIPLVNGLSDQHHPCQVLADLLTLQENFGSLKGLTIAYIGDGNNMLHSWLLMAPVLGVNVNFCCPEKYQPDVEILERASTQAQKYGARVESFQTPAAAVAQAHGIYTDVWASMGFESEQAERLKVFEGFQVNEELRRQALPEAVIMHCMPMNKGQEITQEMVDHPRSVLFQQSENRLHAQKALLTALFS